MTIRSSDLLQGFRLGSWKIEPLRGAVTGTDGETRHLEPKVMDVFVCLAEHANELEEKTVDSNFLLTTSIFKTQHPIVSS